jgi:ADP-ribose pyrophosphatase YjhB (NUDIX family)
MQTLTPRLGFFRNQTQIHKSSTEDANNEQLTKTQTRAHTHNPKKETVSQDYYLARGPRFETQQIEKIELDQIPFSSHTRPSTLRLLLAFHTVDQQPLFFPHARHHKEENTPKKIKIHF